LLERRSVHIGTNCNCINFYGVLELICSSNCLVEVDSYESVRDDESNVRCVRTRWAVPVSKRRAVEDSIGNHQLLTHVPRSS
jgi:hypothetical protein